MGQPHITDSTALSLNKSPDELKVNGILANKEQHMQAVEPEWSFENLTTMQT